MTTPPLEADLRVEQSKRALLALIETDRARQCGQILHEAHSRAAATRALAHAQARARTHQAFEGQRQRRREQIAAAQARLATHRRRHEQQRSAALLRLAWLHLPAELGALWQQGAARSAWVARVVAAAQTRLPRGEWRIVYGPAWPALERQALGERLTAASGATPRWEADASIAAGLKVVCDGNVIDGTLDGLLADRAELEARLLRQLEAPL